MSLNLNDYDDILILAGAGMGIDAGLPDYNEMHDMVDEAATIHQIDPYMIEHPDFYKQNPRAAWGMKARVMNMFLTKSPHSGYYTLKEQTKTKNVFIVTSNIDNHFRDAGFNESKLYEIHGRLTILQCIHRECNKHHHLWPLDHMPKEENMMLTSAIPKCRYCNSYSRPNVCFTDDNSFCKKLRDAQQARFKDWIKRVANKRKPKLLILEIGCGRHRDSIGIHQLEDGTFRVLSKELSLPKQLNESNIKVIRVNPDRNIKKESWETVYYQRAIDFLTPK